MLLNSHTYFEHKATFDAYYDGIVERSRTIERHLSGLTTFSGYCDCCRAVVPLTVSAGVYFGTEVSLRAGCVCPNGVNNRARLILRLVNELAPPGTPSMALFEHMSPLHSALTREQRYQIVSSEYFGPEHRSGDIVRHGETSILHQDMTATAYGDGQFDLIVHNDVLEHVPDFRAALAECRRILRPGGTMVFTAPFFVQLASSEVLAHIDSNRNVVHNIDPPEYHGDSIRGRILAFYHYGWDLVTAMRSAGFSTARVAMNYDPFSGIVSDNHPVIRGGNMPPIALVAER